ncbi:hypothetical protein [Curtobacterium sp. 20TX0008]|uniref:hypothetical protein n=1 Tax=Curtobacterium sp. 20TX0008 TaxID=3022018 RepID=UPI00233086DC|nr:hypothetical protein [Curtobacterium sp. 20TX0008]MDB6427103.1 hypothetical protein [Curtobacterium sp. 20TX0008]
MVQEFITRLDRGEPVGPGIDAGLLVTDVVVAIHESLETGERITLAATTGESAER